MIVRLGDLPLLNSKIPVPKRRGYEWPFRHMKVRDSFLVPKWMPDYRARNAASNYGRRHGMKFTTRITSDGLRVWRIE